MQQLYVAAMTGSALMGAAAFLPWLRLGSISLRGVSDPAGYFVLGLALLGMALGALGASGRRPTANVLALVGLAGFTTLTLVWAVGSSSVADRARARAEAIAIVDRVAQEPVPPVRIGAGMALGLLGAAATAGSAAVALARDRGRARS